MVKTIRRNDSHVTAMEQKMREAAMQKNPMEIAQEYMSDDLAAEFFQELRQWIFYNYAWKKANVVVIR